jgi:acetyl esterase/lipase
MPPARVAQASRFSDAFDRDGQLWVPASTLLDAHVAHMRALPAAASRDRADIAAARIAFDSTINHYLLAAGLDVASPGIRSGLLDADGVRLAFAEPEGPPRGAVLHIHGGGWCLGNAQILLPALAMLAERTQAVVASVEYRLAPEAPHPAALNDCEHAALWWLRDLALERGIPSERVVLAGESAGAHLALLTLLRLRARDIRLAGAALTYGMFDLTNSLPSRHVLAGETLGLDAEACRFYVRMLLGEDVAPGPAVSPLQLPLRELAGLPPTLFCAGTLDPLRDDSIEVHRRWQQAGNRSWLALYERAPHAFDLLRTPEGEHLQDLRAGFIRQCLPT